MARPARCRAGPDGGAIRSCRAAAHRGGAVRRSSACGAVRWLPNRKWRARHQAGGGRGQALAATTTGRSPQRWENDFHDNAARAALAYTEAITRVADATVADDFGTRHDALAEHFSQEEILEIIGIVINMNVWTRLKLAEGASPGPPQQTTS
jgi:alkylhydroperoxidase family enzyme